MSENNNIEHSDPQETKQSAEEKEDVVKKRRRIRHRVPVKKQGPIAGMWPKIAIAAIILCLVLAGLSFFIGNRDITIPIIQNISISDIAQTSAIINWQTNEPATSEVSICSSDNCTSLKPNESLVTNHSVTVTDIKPATRYQLTVISRDQQGKEAKLTLELVTPAKTYAVPLDISGIKTSYTVDSGVVISWQTNRPATSQVEYGENNVSSLSTPLDNKLTTNHRVSLTGLKTGTTYQFKVKSEDAGKNLVTSEAQTFTTLSANAAAVEVGAEIGKRAPDFTLPTIDGNQVSLSQFRGKIVMLNFWQSSCPSCTQETPYIQAVFNTWPNDKLQILAVSVNERAVFVQTFLDSRGLTFPVLLDSDGAVSNSYQVPAFPSTYFIDADGIIREIKSGHFSSQFEIETMLQSL
jgi:peroxiredoxin